MQISSDAFVIRLNSRRFTSVSIPCACVGLTWIVAQVDETLTPAALLPRRTRGLEDARRDWEA